MGLKIGENQILGSTAKADLSQSLIIIDIGRRSYGPDHGKVRTRAKNIQSQLTAVGKKGIHPHIAGVDVVDTKRWIFAPDKSFAFAIFQDGKGTKETQELSSNQI